MAGHSRSVNDQPQIFWGASPRCKGFRRIDLPNRGAFSPQGSGIPLTQGFAMNLKHIFTVVAMVVPFGIPVLLAVTLLCKIKNHYLGRHETQD